ncbi:MAG: DHH family phosphoesterase [Planctomycetota bacterium]
MYEKSVTSSAVRDTIAARISEARRILLCTHTNPDGDGLGSMLALARSARQVGREARVVVAGEVPRKYGFLFEDETPLGVEDLSASADWADVLVVVDTTAVEQLTGMVAALQGRAEKLVVIDHHASGGTLGPLQWVDPSAAAAGLLVGELLEELGWPLDVSVARCLTVAVLSDTGWMHFSNTDARVLRAVARWLETGVEPDVLYDRLFQRDRVERLRLMARVIDSLELYHHARLAVMVLRRKDFDQTGARREETENLINEALRIETVDVAILLTETPDRIRVSLRSRCDVDVSAIAAEFGGGGHPRAAGLKSNEPIDELRRRLIRSARAALDLS